MSTPAGRARSRRTFLAIAAALVAVVATGAVVVAQNRRSFDVSGRKYSFKVSGSEAAEIRVFQNDLVHVSFSTEDIAHSFTIIDEPYRIMRRAEPGKPVSFDFRADRAGSFRFYCSLTIDDGCKNMHGTLVVEGKSR